jgi:hypothetical protein
MSSERVEVPLRDLPIFCSRCGWTVNLVASATNPENYDITPFNGWSIAPGQEVLCERCSTGWHPQSAEAQRLRDALHLAYDWMGRMEPTSAWEAAHLDAATEQVQAALRGAEPSTTDGTVLPDSPITPTPQDPS